MAAYVIADVEILDPVGYEEYRRVVTPLVARHRGRFLARGGQVQVLEGSWNPKRIVVLEFESSEAARAWYGSPEYQEALKLRQRASRGSLILVEGV